MSASKPVFPVHAIPWAKLRAHDVSWPSSVRAKARTVPPSGSSSTRRILIAQAHFFQGILPIVISAKWAGKTKQHLHKDMASDYQVRFFSSYKCKIMVRL